MVVSIENPYSDGTPLNVVGILRAEADITDPYDEDEFAFAIGDEGGMTVTRSHFVGASFDGREIQVENGPSEQTLVLRIGLFESDDPSPPDLPV